MRTLLLWAIVSTCIAQHSSYFCNMQTYHNGIVYTATNPAHWVEVSYVGEGGTFGSVSDWGELYWSPSITETNWHYLSYGLASEGITNCIKVWMSEDNPIYTNMLDNGAGYFIMTTEGAESVLGSPEFSHGFWGDSVVSTNTTGGGGVPPVPGG